MFRKWDVMEDKKKDLGFTFKVGKSGDISIKHRGILAATLRGAKADKFLKKKELSDFGEMQQIMARLTGNYKRGTERSAKNHPRNKV